MPIQKLLYIDMDDVLCDYSGAFKLIKDQQPEIKFPQSIPGFFEHLVPMANAIESFLNLSNQFDVHILSAPSVFNPLSYTEKRIWVENNLGFDFVHKLILATNKGLLKGDYLID
jgi:5'(3')-deoxyribonucleotidase